MQQPTESAPSPDSSLSKHSRHQGHLAPGSGWRVPGTTFAPVPSRAFSTDFATPAWACSSLSCSNMPTSTPPA